MRNSPAPVEAGQRIEALDLLRGVAVLGILLVNAPSFAMPPEIGDTPTLSPLPFGPADAALWWIKHVLFEQKFVTLFSMLFGVSVFLVGGPGGRDRGARARRAVLWRRILWLAVIGALHGALVWFGDILLLYAMAGLVMIFCRGWGPVRLTLVGLPLMAWSIYRLLDQEFAFQALAAEARETRAPGPADMAAFIDRFDGELDQVQLANLDFWWLMTDFSPRFYGPMTLGLMMLGLALFHTGVLTGRASRGRYLGLVAIGAAALAVIGWNAADQLRDGFPSATRAWDYIPNLTLAPLVSLGYVGLIGLALQSDRFSGVKAALAAVGRMAFTNYLVQSLIMTTFFYGGRGLGLFGRLDWTAWTLMVLAVWAFQIGASSWWLSRWRMGPMEWLWRRLSYGRPVPLSRTAPLQRGAIPPA